MSDPIALPNGGQYDLRGLMVGACAALFGPRAGLIVFATAMIYRTAIGDPGLAPGLLHISIAFGVGLAWHRYARNLTWPDWGQSVVLGLGLSTTALAILLAPRDMWATLAVVLVPYALVSNIFGTLLIRYLVGTELKFLDSTAGLEKAAKTDHLTGLLNRRSLEDRYTELTVDGQADRALMALYFDIDNFKAINDTYGHAAGDAVLQAVSSRLSSTFRSEDVFCRLGGDEFVVILPGLNENEAQAVAERCRKVVADTPIIANEDKITATISIGAVWTEKAASFQRLLHQADRALYEAKSNGRNAVAFQTRPQQTEKQRASA